MMTEEIIGIVGVDRWIGHCEMPRSALAAALKALGRESAITFNILINTVPPRAFHTEALRHDREATGATARGYDADDLGSNARWAKDNFSGRLV
jgi:hypothetical protein